MKGLSLGISMLFMLLLFPWTSPVQANSAAIQLIIEGQTLQPDVPPQLVQGRTMVPIRIIAEEMGAEVGWDNQQRKVTIQSNSIDLTMHVGQKKAKVNGKEVAMDVPPVIDKGRTLVPLRFVGESLGTTVGWEQDTRSVIVNQAYSLEANGTVTKQSVIKLGDEFYFPLKDISSYVGAVFQTAKMDQVDRLIYGDLNISVADQGRKQLKLRKLDTGWMIPQSVVEDQFEANVEQRGSLIVIEKVSKLQSVREEDGKIIIQTSSRLPLEHFLMEGPHRLVIDLPNTVIGEEMREAGLFNGGMGVIRKERAVAVLSEVTDLGQSELPLEEPLETPSGTLSETPTNESLVEPIDQEEAIPEPEQLIREIRFSQFSIEPQTVRIVVELEQKVKYELNPLSEGWEVTLETMPRKEGFLILLDPGHGGKDPGAKGVSGNSEKDFTLAVSKLLKEELKQYKGLQVVETRSDDTYPTLQDRVLLANDVQADLFLSIHANAFKPETRGTETYYYSSQSEQLAKTIHRYLLEATGFPDRGTKKAGYYVIKNTNMPSALIEIGFLTNAAENNQMLNPEFQKRVAQALGKAINEYYISYQ